MPAEYFPSTSIRGVDPQLMRDLRTAYELIYSLRQRVETLTRELAQARPHTGDGTGGVTPAGDQILRGFGSPLNRVVAPPGSLYIDRNGGAGVTLWVKESAQDSTGWTAK